MIKVLVAALVGTIVGIVVMVVVIAISGTDTSGASSEGLGALPLSTYSSSASTPPSTSTPSSSNGGSSGGGGGDAEAGKAVWEAQGCGSCHTLAAAGASGTVGPDLDTALSNDEDGTPLADFVKESIVDPDKVIASGFTAGLMPTDFGTKISQTDLDNLVALITQGK